ncbi:hydrolase [Luteitalea sp. TBR-22]|uniref:dienelactone hydrolase family protein n=1 Tax=Luteitalea sp. TBR-22 TaxID=2802971 RepID=UPI001AF4D5A7|nr:alpha/beta hydrolase family protein [Luteitalea sp. TBR-22]BCS35089.1 hydrolase [Luteitalea sp. TBR-22]
MPEPTSPARLDRRRFLQATAAIGALPSLASAPAAGAAHTAQAAAPASTPDVGSLFPFIRSQAVAGEFPLSFLQSRFTDVRAWRRDTLAKVLDLLHYAPAPCPPAAEKHESVDCGDYVRERITFSTTPDIRVPAYVLVPKGASASKPAPAIVALHDHGGFYLWGKEKLVPVQGEHAIFREFRERYYGGRAIAEDLARRGYVVIVIDMFYWGDRRMLLDDDPADWRERPSTMTPERIQAFNTRASQNEQLVGRTIFSAGFTWPGVMFWDDIRTVDYLRSRPDVHPERIGCVGLSVGAVRAAHLAALDDRVKAGVVVCWMTSFPKQLRKHVKNTIGHTKVVPGLHRLLDYPDVASLAMPRPMLFMSGSRDALFDVEGIKASFTKLEACYAKAGVPDRCRTQMYDSPHQFNAEMQAQAWEWLGRHV